MTDLTQRNSTSGSFLHPIVDTVVLKPPSFFRKWVSLMVLSLALMIIVIDTTLLNVSLGTLIREFNTNIQSMQWVISAYSLVLAAFTITGGRLGDIYGRKKMFMLGAAIFAIGSFISSISINVTTMIWGEAIIEGIGAALMLPATASLIVAHYKGRDRALAFGVWGGVAAAGLAIGPILGGYLTTNYSWRWGFRINIVIVALLLIGSMFIKEVFDNRKKITIDWFGIILSAIGLFFLVFGVIEASIYGWWTAKQVFIIGSYQIGLVGNLSISVLSFIWGAIFIILFVLWELFLDRKGKIPLVSMHLFQNKQFTSGLLTQAVISLGQSGTIFSVALFLQSVGNLTALQTGISLIPMAITLFIASPLAAYLSKKISPKSLIMIGLSINICALILLRESINPNATAWTVAPALALYGIGIGFVISQITNLTLSAVPVEVSGEASGINSTLRLVGQTLGSAVIGSVLLTTLSSSITTNIQKSSVIPDNLKPELNTRILKNISSVEFGNSQKNTSLSSSVNTEITTISKKSMTDANKTSLLLGASIVLLGFITASFLPKNTLSKPRNSENPIIAQH